MYTPISVAALAAKRHSFGAKCETAACQLANKG